MTETDPQAQTLVLKKILKKLKKRQETERLRYFVPNGKQKEFIKALGENKSFVNLFVGANGVGKTALIINILGNIIWGPQNDYFNFPLFQNFTFPKRIRIATGSKNVEEMGSIDTEIKKWWPQGKYEGYKNGKLYLSQYRTDTGFLIDKMSYEQETSDFESVTLGLAVFDEPPPKDKYAATVLRMRSDGVIVFSMTPLMDAAWVQDEIIDSHGTDSRVVFADIESNCKQHGVDGQMDHAVIEKIISNLDPQEREARINGRFMHLNAVIFGGLLDRSIHIIPNDITPPAGSQWGMVVDPARGKPWAMGWFWYDARGQIVFESEYPLEDWTKCRETQMMTKDFADVIHVMEQGKNVNLRIIDRHYANARDNYNRTLKMDLADKFNLEFQNSYNSENEVEFGIRVVKDYLGYNKSKPLDTGNFPKLLIKERCKNIIRGLERWSRDTKLLKPEENSVYKDHCDLVRYACVAQPEIYRYRALPPRKQNYALGRF